MYGLNRYDGERFQTYRRLARDERSLSSNYINCLLEDRQHRLWVSTNFGGLNRLDSSGVRFVRYTLTTDKRDISSAAITGLAQDAQELFGLPRTGMAYCKSTRPRARFGS